MSRRDAPPLTVTGARADLAGSRAALLDSLSHLTELDFAKRTTDGVAIVDALIRFAAAERTATAAAQPPAAQPPAAQPSAEPAPAEPAADGETGRILPPQAVHQLAGARYATISLLDRLEASDPSGDATLPPAVATAYTALAVQEQALATRITEARGSEAQGSEAQGSEARGSEARDTEARGSEARGSEAQSSA